MVVAADAFTDVADTNVHHDDITWLRDADVTRGCNPPANDRFCPGDPVLRQQMASFMRRLAENKVVDAATAVQAEHAASADDADTVDGVHASEILRAGTNGGNTSVLITGTSLNTDPNILNELTVTVPADGGLLVLWSAWRACNGADIAEVRLHVDGTGDDSFFVVPSCDAADDYATHSAQTLIPVAEGTYQLQIRARDFDGGANNLTLLDSRLTAAYVAFDLAGDAEFAPLGTQSGGPSGDGPGH